MVWIFAYGSLVFRPSFDFAARVPARLDGWARRFFQGSTDHRGVPRAPGRVVTLVRDATTTCDGVAYGIDGTNAANALAHLDLREQGGYDRHEVELAIERGSSHERVTGVAYVAGPSNPEWLGPAPLDDIARQIANARGPSGSNAEYILSLALALRGLGVDDAHVFDVEDRVRALLAASGGTATLPER